MAHIAAAAQDGEGGAGGQEVPRSGADLGREGEGEDVDRASSEGRGGHEGEVCGVVAGEEGDEAGVVGLEGGRRRGRTGVRACGLMRLRGFVLVLLPSGGLGALFLGNETAF